MPDNRLEEEISEILDGLDKLPEPAKRRTSARKQYLRQLASTVSNSQRAIARKLSLVSVGQLMLLSFLIIVASVFLRRFIPLTGQWTLLAGIVLFVSSFTIMIFGGAQSSRGQYWRGRQIESRSSSLLSKLRKRISIRRRKNG